MIFGISLLVNKLIGVPNWKVEIWENILSISTCMLSKSLLYKGNAVSLEPCNLVTLRFPVTGCVGLVTSVAVGSRNQAFIIMSIFLSCEHVIIFNVYVLSHE